MLLDSKGQSYHAVMIVIYFHNDEVVFSKGFSGQILTNGGLDRFDSRGGISIVGAPVTVLYDSSGSGKVPTLTGHLGGNLAVEWTQVRLIAKAKLIFVG